MNSTLHLMILQKVVFALRFRFRDILQRGQVVFLVDHVAVHVSSDNLRQPPLTLLLLLKFGLAIVVRACFTDFRLVTTMVALVEYLL